MNGKGSAMLMEKESKKPDIPLLSIDCTSQQLAGQLLNAFHMAYARTLNKGKPLPEGQNPLKFIEAWHMKKFETTEYMPSYLRSAEEFARGIQYRMQENMHGKMERGNPEKPSYFFRMGDEDLKLLARELTAAIGVPLSGKLMPYEDVRIPADHVPVAFVVSSTGKDNSILPVWPKWIGAAQEEYKEPMPEQKSRLSLMVPKKIGGT